MILIVASIYPLAGDSGSRVVIGAKNFEEQYTLSALIADRLASAGFASTNRSDLGSSIVFHALASSDLDVYVDYSGTIWANEMHRTDMPGRATVLQQMARWLKTKYGILRSGFSRVRERLCFGDAA